MSLVSEALKKAEREAAAREAREKGLPQPLETPSQPYRARRGQRRGGGARFLVAALGAAAFLIALAVVLDRTAPGEKGSSKGSSASPSASSSATSATLTPAPSERGPAVPTEEPVPSTRTNAEKPLAVSSAGEATAAGAPPHASSQTASQQPQARPSESEPAADPTPAIPTPRSATQEPPPPREPAARGGRDVVRSVELPDGSRLTLGGIAYSETAPFAYLNGKLLKVGEGTAGYTLVKIERELVVVRGALGDLTIRLKPR